MSGSDGVDWDNSASRFPGSRSAAPGSAFPHYFAIRNPIQDVDGTYLEHQPEEEHHSNTGNNICMVLDDKLVAHHRRILVGLFTDPHVDAVWPQTFFFKERSRRSLRYRYRSV